MFVVLNAWFVVPHFSDLAEAKKRRADALAKMKRWQVEIDQKAKYQAGISKFIKEGQEVQAEDQVNQFARTIQEQQARSGTGIGNFGKNHHQNQPVFLGTNRARQCSMRRGTACGLSYTALARAIR